MDLHVGSVGPSNLCVSWTSWGDISLFLFHSLRLQSCAPQTTTTLSFCSALQSDPLQPHLNRPRSIQRPRTGPVVRDPLPGLTCHFRTLPKVGTTRDFGIPQRTPLFLGVRTSVTVTAPSFRRPLSFSPSSFSPSLFRFYCPDVQGGLGRNTFVSVVSGRSFG